MESNNNAINLFFRGLEVGQNFMTRLRQQQLGRQPEAGNFMSRLRKGKKYTLDPLNQPVQPDPDELTRNAEIIETLKGQGLWR